MFLVLTVHLDESYNNRTMAVGGWLCDNDTWEQIERAWIQRIAFENRLSLKQRFKPISRYHAADCSNLKNEFEGWPVERQIGFSKKLIEIIGRNKPIGFVFGASREDLLSYYPQLEKHWKIVLFYLCFTACLEAVGTIMDNEFSSERVAIIHERGPLDAKAKQAFDNKLASPNFPQGRYFTTIAPLAWQDCVALQSADLFAYEGFKLFESRRNNNERLRKSLQKIVGSKVRIRAGWVRKEYFENLNIKGAQP
jgi:hypothetical protein